MDVLLYSYIWQKSKEVAGFTLVELSMVLVIIGLLVGGVLAGQVLIRSAELRGIVSEKEQFVTAVQTFKLKHNCLPGDCLKATDFFGTKADCANRNEYTQTCNGNGDGMINPAVSTVTVGNEQFLFWQHLTSAGLIAGKLNGVEGTLSVHDIEAGINAPKGKIASTAWATFYHNASTAASPDSHIKVNFKNFLAIGFPTSSNGWFGGSLLNPSEMYQIDKKIDDGKPARGKLVIRWWSFDGGVTSSGCTNMTINSDLDADYLLTTNEVKCLPQFIDAF